LRSCGRTSAWNGRPPTLIPVSSESAGALGTACEKETAMRRQGAIEKEAIASRFLGLSGGAKLK
jgi:hypothetical protein